METKNSIYVFCIGWAESGKSSFQSLLLRAIYQGRDFHLRVAPKSRSGERETTEAAYQELRRTWEKNQLPMATPVNKFIESRYVMSPLEEGRPSIYLTLLDVSGEDLAEIVQPKKEDFYSDGGFTAPQAYCLHGLSLEKGSQLFIFGIVDPRRDDNDTLIEYVTDFLIENLPASTIRESVLSIVLTRPNIAISRLPRNREVYYQNNPMDLELCDEYLDRYEPAALKILRAWRGKQLTFTLKIDRSFGPEGEQIYQFPIGDIEGILQAIYDSVGAISRSDSKALGLFDSVELKPGIFGIKVDLKSLYKIIKGRR